MKRWILLALCLATVLRAQYPPGVRWRKIQTPHYEVVFPSEIESDAQRAANMLETLYGPLTDSLGGKFKRTTVLLPNQSITRYVGGYVDLFPRQLVINSMPSQGFYGTNDWLTALAAREGRHLAQLAKMNHGFGKVAGTMFGEAGTVTALFWSVPLWWLYGDSRVAETQLLRGGVGQFASSEVMTRALLLSGQHFSYMKAMHGSFKDAVPGQDELGAFLVSHVNRTAGPDAWSQVLARTTRGSWNPFAFSMALKKETGRSAAANYSETMSEVGELWQTKAATMQFSAPAILNPTVKPAFTSYFHPVFEADGSVLAQKAGLDTFPVEMVRIHPDGREEKLFKVAPTVAGSNRTSIVKDRMVMDEYIPDLRWNRGFSEIVIRDIATGHKTRLTHRTRFMNPVLSPDGERVAVVEFLPDRRCSLVILDAHTGAELRRIPSPGNDMLYTPAWSEDGRRLAFVRQSAKGRSLAVADLEAGTFKDAIPHCDEELALPVFYRDYVLYKSSPDGTVNIYAVNTETGKRYRVTAAKFAADSPAISPDGTKLVYNDYTSQGSNLAELPLDPATWTSVDDLPFVGLGYHGAYRDYSAEAAGTEYPVGRYHPSLHLFDFHSWGPSSAPPDVGFGVQSNDKMGLMSLNASLLYNTNEGTMGFETSGSYRRFFPVLDFSFSDRNRKLQFTDHEENFSERTLMGGFHIPLNLSRGYYSTGLSVGANVEHITLRGGSLSPLTYRFGFSRSHQRNARDLAPPWAQVLRLTYRQTPWPAQYQGNFLSADGRFALPGLMRHHSLVLESGYERQNGNYYFSSERLFPRGYTAITAPTLTKFSGNYAFPFLYPDWALGQLLYIKRVSANLFYDYGKVVDRQFRSTGIEAIFDLGVLHFPDSFRFGLRYAYRIDYHNRRFQPFAAYSW